jgi:adenylate cyclase class 2
VSASHSNREIEIKLRVSSAREARRLLRAAGFQTVRPRVFEDNWVFDTPRRTLARSGRLLRIRQAGRAASLTFKGPAARGRHKSRGEFEMVISDSRMASVILQKLGFEPAFRYQKYRTEYGQVEARGVVSLDETPYGCYLEIEGAPRWIDRTSRALGFSESDYLTASYAALYREYCDAKGLEPGDMLFPRRTPRSSG